MMIDTLARLPATSGFGNAETVARQLLGGAERLLWEASERALRQPRDRLVVVLHLSRLAPPAPRPHHMRVARVLMQDSASRFGGQVFAMRNKDLVLLCARSDLAPAASAGVSPSAESAPESLPPNLARLFAADVPDPARLTSLWRLDRDARALFAYIGECAASPAELPADDAPPQDERYGGVLDLTALQAILSHAPLIDLMVQQTGMSLGPDRERSLADRLAPAFRELDISLSALSMRRLISRATGDPFLFRHLASSMEQRLIQLLIDDLAAGGRLTRPAIEAGLPIHLDLGLDAILSPGFARLSHQAASRGLRVGAAISIMQACADLDLMEHARRVLALTDGALILSRVDAAALGIITPAALQPDLLKLIWSPALLGGGQYENERCRPDGILAGLDPARVVLQEVDSQLALAWGQSHGITLFQGPFLDQVQGASRMAACHGAGFCTLKQCCARGAAMGEAGRAGCANPALLEAGTGTLP